MAYKIRYQSVPQRKPKGYKKRFMLLTICFFALFILLAHQLVPTQLQQLYDILFPYHPVDALLQDLKDGEAFIDAVSAFCKELVNGQ